ncbi:MAG: GntR family transcriptional regulator [Anaerolineales bacterium]|nr:GntR family transcriptional regulator [Anaerolineales bacterium]
MDQHALRVDAPEPLYSQLARELAEQMKAGVLNAGDKLPSIRDLELNYNVSSITVRKALEELRQADLVFSVPGKGSFVSKRLIRQVLPTSEGFTDMMEKNGVAASSIVHRADIQYAGDELGRMFGIRHDAEVVLLERVRMGDDTPFCFQQVFLPHVLCPGILDFDFRTSSLYNILEREYGLRMGKSRHVIQARLAEEGELLHLNLTPPSPVLQVEHWSYTASGQLFEDGKTTYRADLYQISSTMHEYELR